MSLESNDCRLKREYTVKDRLYWNLMLALPLVTAMIGIGQQSTSGLILYLILVAIGVGLILRFFCTHCPHYIREQSAFSCLFFWKTPKLFPDREGPLGTREKILVGLAAFLILGLPIFWLLGIPSLLLIYILSVAVFVSTHLRTECSRCLFVDCPMNKVPVELHEEARNVE